MIVDCFLLSLSRDESLAEELTQETMFRAIMNINSFRGDSKPSVWLCQIGKNLYFEWLKKSKRTIPIDDSLATYDSGYDIAEAFADKDIANQILKYLHELVMEDMPKANTHNNNLFIINNQPLMNALLIPSDLYINLLFI